MSPQSETGSRRRERLREAHLYFVCDAHAAGGDASEIVEAALRGGADIVQLREKSGDEEAALRAGRSFRALCDSHGALFIVNDRPDLALALQADGVHVGQDDVPVSEAREVVGPDMLVGRSTHSTEQLAAARGADQLSVGPVWVTPTKEGRPATGLELIRAATAVAPEVPWFAIGGIDTDRVDSVRAAGARRVVVVRAIRDAPDPEAAARDLRRALTEPVRSPTTPQER